MALLSCSEERGGPGPQVESIPVSFGTAIEGGVGDSANGENTRATPITTATLGTSQQFRVYSFRLPSPDGGTTPGTPANAMGDYLMNQYSSSNYANAYWTGSTYYYNGSITSWPSPVNDCLMFYAVYPYSLPTGGVVTMPYGSVSNPKMQITYEMPLAPSEQVDLMYAGTNALYRTVVPLGFRHALTRVTFKAKLISPSTDGGKVWVARLQLKGVRSKGTITVDRNQQGTWVLSSGQYDTRNIDLSMNTGDCGLPINNAGYYPQWAGNGRLNGTSAYQLKDDAFTSIMPTNGDLMVLPQAVDDMMLDIDLLVAKPNGTVVTEKNYLMLPPEYPWTQGRHVEYSLFIARDVIYIGVYITIWKVKDDSENPYTAGDITLES
ncbi:hypothetical protein FACS1894159_05210 [Bacteroidia bacterium]|nr:hypothetical protein FACS1894159_05210 [Bacteroidia bacterium]